MGRVLFIMVLLCLCSKRISAQSTVGDVSDTITSHNAFVQPARDTTDYEALYRKEVAKQDSLSGILKILTARRKALQSDVGKDDKKLNAKIEKKKRDLDSRNKGLAAIRQKMQDSKLPGLLTEREQLQTSIETLKADTISLASDIAKINEEIVHYSADMIELESIKDNVSRQVIDESKSYLELPFSEMTQDKLLSIKEKCRKYAIDKNINAFIAKTENIIEYKRIFDEATNIVNSKFSKANVDRVTDGLQMIKNIDDDQMDEFDLLRKQLSHFESGLTVFKEFIVELNRRREGVTNYTLSDYNDDYPHIMKKNNIEERIKSYIRIVPYLNKMFSEYVNIITTTPTIHPDIETEILNQ